MTISSELSVHTYDGDGSTVAFAVQYYFQAASHLEVILVDEDGNEDPQTLNTDYTVSGTQTDGMYLNGGTVTFTSAPASTEQVVIRRKPPMTQTVSLNGQDPFPAKVIERNLADKLVMMVQYVAEMAGRAIKVPYGETLSNLQDAATRAGKILGFHTTTGAPVLYDRVDVGAVAAEDVAYDNVASGAAAENAQEAIDELFSEKINKAGDTMTGLLTLSGAPTSNLHAATKLYVDQRVPTSPLDYGATGDGVADDATEYALAEAALSLMYLPLGRTFALGTADPVDPIYGPGNIVSDGVTLGGAVIRYYADRSSVAMTPTTQVAEDWLYATFPASSNHGNTLFGAGIGNTLDSNFVRTTAFGSLILTDPVTIDRIDAFGQGVMRWTRYGERNSAFGTLSMQWGGADLSLDPNGDYYQHDLLYNGGVSVDLSAWDAFDLETNNPGIRQDIEDWLALTPWAATTADFAFNCGFGRDTMVEIVVGLRNSAFGYRALGLLLDGDDNAAFGANALFDNVLATGSTGFGARAGEHHQEGDYNTYVGFAAGRSQVTGGANVIIGVNAGWSADGAMWSGDWNVLIGQDAGRNSSGNVSDFSNMLYIQDRYTRSPLIQGDFANGNVAINLANGGTQKGRFHVFTQAVSQTPQTSGDELVLEGDDAGVSILSANNTTGSIFFGDDGSAIAGYVQYNHSGDYLRFASAATERMRLNVEGLKIGGSAARASTAGTNALHIFNGTAPVGTLTNGCSLYSTSGEMRVMDAAGNATLISPHDRETNEWVFDSVHTPSGRHLHIDVERLLRAVNDHFGWNYVHEAA